MVDLRQTRNLRGGFLIDREVGRNLLQNHRLIVGGADEKGNPNESTPMIVCKMGGKIAFGILCEFV